MKITKKWLALILAGVLTVGLTACGSGGAASSSEAPASSEAEAPASSEAEAPASSEAEAPAESEAPAEEPEEAPAADENTPLVVGYSHFSSKFSPFFASTVYDQHASDMTQLSLFKVDRLGQVIYKGIEGETTEYNGTDYTYYGPADIEVTENEDGSVFYDIKIRDDLVFSDGEPVTVDDLIFAMYVMCDPTYDGGATLFSQPIEGLAEYRSGMSKLGDLIFNAGEDNTDFTNFTEEQQKAYWESYNSATTALAQEIVDYCAENEYAEEGNISAAAAAWGFEVPEGGTIEDFAAALKEGYGADVDAMISTEAAGSTTDDLFPNLVDYSVGVETGDSVPNISGIQKIDDYNLRVVTTEVSAPMIYRLQLPFTPKHYYGDPALYDYENNSFGFPKGDLSLVRAKTSEPMGAGMYKFIKFENGTINYERNDSYFLGTPATKYVNFMEMTDEDKFNGVITGTVDITEPSWSLEKAKQAEDANGGAGITGDVITTSLVNNLGYGYIGMNSKNVSVGGDPASDASKNLRRALATIFSVYRDVSIDSYYGENAKVINYPISDTSWAAPQATDEGYQIAFSTDVDGNDIYTSDMSADDKYAAAKEAALGFFEAAGYTVEGGKVTAAPEGAKLEYEAWIPGDGIGDHPSFMILKEASDALAEIGINLIINDPAVSADLWEALDANQAEIWCAAWGADIDPDMYQVYYSDVANGGEHPGGDWSKYMISDPELDELILETRASTDQAYRKEMLKASLDIVIDWACEIPVYQRQNAMIFSTERVDISTVTPDISTFYGYMEELYNTKLR